MPKNYKIFLRGYVGGWDFSPEAINDILEKNANSEVNVLINSTGGLTYDGVAISSLFKLHGNVNVHFIGYNASAATIAAMGAKHISLDCDGAFLVHKCLYPIFEWDYKNADEIDEFIESLKQIKADSDTIDNCIAGMYARRCKKSKEELLDLMKVGGWLTPQEALDWGFIDEITNDPDDVKPANVQSVISSLDAAGIPLPPNITKQKGSLFSRFIDFLQSPFANKPSEVTNSDLTNSPNIMNQFSTLAALLSVSILESEGKIQFSTEQVSTIESALAERDRQIADLIAKLTERDATIAEQNQTISDLRKEPASATTTVVDDKKDSDPYAPVSAEEALAASRAFMKSSI